jgi:Tol biopolymer transport system component
MKHIFISIVLLSSMLVFSSKSYGQDEFPVLEGPYFGQKPPSLIPEIFAPGIISISGRSEMGVSFSPDLDEMYFTVQKKYGVPADIYFSKLEDKKWTPFKKANFTKDKKAGEMEPNLSYDGNKIYFTAYNTDFTDTSIWYVNRLDNGWSNAIKLDSPLNKHEVMTSTLAKNGDLYYTNLSKRFKTYYSPNINGKYPKFHEAEIEFGAHAFISPSQDYLLVDARSREDKNQKADLYVYFKQKGGAWTKPINLGITVNSTFDETVATVTPDGKYLIFSRRTEGDSLNLYWVSTEVIENVRPKL